jgi:hypothetical protein
LKEFTDFTNKTPDKLLKEAENEIMFYPEIISL